MSVLPNLLYRFNAVSITILGSYLSDINKWILMFIWKGSRPRTVNKILKKKKGRGLTILNFKTI